MPLLLNMIFLNTVIFPELVANVLVSLQKSLYIGSNLQAGMHIFKTDGSMQGLGLYLG